MAISYDRLFKLLKNSGLRTTDLTKISGISFNVVGRLKRDEYVSMESIEKICRCLKCDIEDVMTITDTE